MFVRGALGYHPAMLRDAASRTVVTTGKTGAA
jgi:hypothetical protein